MPKLPDREDAPQARIYGPSAAQTPSMSIATGNARAAQQLGNAIEGFGKDVSKALEASEKERDAEDLLEANAAWQSQMIGLKRGFRDDPDYKTYGKRWAEGSKSVTESIASNIRNPKARKEFMLRKGMRAEEMGQSIYERGENMREEETSARVDARLSSYVKTATNPDIDPSERAAAREYINDELAIAEDSGLITPGRAAEKRREYAERVRKESELALLERDPAQVLERATLYQKEIVQQRSQRQPLSIQRYDGPRQTGRQRTKEVRGIIAHYTEGGTNMDGLADWANKSNTGYNYYIDREGNVIEFASDEIAMNHAGEGRRRPGDKAPHLGNGNSIGIGIMTPKGGKATPAQIEAFRKLSGQLAERHGLKTKDVFGHGEVAVGHRQSTEAMDAVTAVREQGFSRFTTDGRPILENQDGSISTEETVTVQVDGKWMNLPSIVGGKRPPDGKSAEEWAVEQYRAGNNKPTGTFETVEKAVSAAQERTKELGDRYASETVDGSLPAQEIIRREEIADTYDAMTPAEIYKLQADAERAIKVRDAAARQSMKRNFEAHIKSIELDGVGQEGFDVSKLPESEQATAARRQQRAFAYHSLTRDVASMSAAEMTDNLAKIVKQRKDLAGKPEAMELYELEKQLDAKYKEVRKQRSDDPAEAVKNTPEVAAFYQRNSVAEMGAGGLESMAAWEELIDVRKQAQEDIGIPHVDRRILTQQEAFALVPDLTREDPREVRRILEESIQVAQTRYGKYAKAAIEEALRARNIWSKENYASIVKKELGDNLYSARELRLMERQSQLMGEFAAGAGFMADPRAMPPQDIYGQTAESRGPDPFGMPTPTVSQYEWAKSKGPDGARIYDQTFGDGAFERSRKYLEGGN